jgi:hypothetical protein
MIISSILPPLRRQCSTSLPERHCGDSSSSYSEAPGKSIRPGKITTQAPFNNTDFSAIEEIRRSGRWRRRIYEFDLDAFLGIWNSVMRDCSAAVPGLAYDPTQ